MRISRKRIDKLTDYVWNWLCNWYDIPMDSPLPNKIYLSKTASFACYWRYKSKLRLVVSDWVTRYWNTYARKRVGKVANNIPTKNPYHDIELQLVHELTHHIQVLQNRRGMIEVEATQNEIEYAELHKHLYYLYEQLEEYK